METQSADIQSSLESAFRLLKDFVNTPEFKSLLAEMWQLPFDYRHEFVDLVLLDQEQLAMRGVVVPDGIDIQRSWFADKRPTLFCVTKKLPPGVGWKKATITFDNPLSEQGRVGWVPCQ